MRLKYHKQIVDMLYNEWDLGKRSSKAKGKTCAWIYWFEILSEAEQVITEKQDHKIVGVCAYSKWDSKQHLLRKKFYGLLKDLFIHSPLIKDKKAIEKYLHDYDYLPEELENYFDGEIAILIVQKEYRGKKIGKKLLMQAFELAKKDEMKNIQILSDESCNYQFYEALDCKKVYETVILNGEPDKLGSAVTEKGFIYEKKLKGCIR